MQHQGTILESNLQMDGPSTLTISLHEGYDFPAKGFRIACFNPETGAMLPRYQHTVTEVEGLSDGRILLTFDDEFLRHYRPETEKAAAVGNFICLEVSLLSHRPF
jgi:hypothetical protein